MNTFKSDDAITFEHISPKFNVKEHFGKLVCQNKVSGKKTAMVRCCIRQYNYFFWYKARIDKRS